MQPIHWFPGHMAKARREMSEALKAVDAVLELVDARLPVASANPMLRDLLGAKPKAVVLTRIDLADPKETAKWEKYFQGAGYPVVTVDAKSGKGIRDIVPALEKAAKAKREKDAKRGIRPRPLRTMVVGIPNVGKSSLINRLAGRAATKTGDRPGITKTQQWIRLGQVELLDTPGVLWPKLEDPDSAYKLAISGAIKSDILDLQSICSYFVLWSGRRYPEALKSRYAVSEVPTAEFTDPAEVWPIVEPIMEEIAKRRGLMRSGGVPDVERAAELVLREVQTGIVGRMTLEWVDDLKLDEEIPDIES